MTTCVSCGTENPADASFCMSCGTALSSTCESCGAELPDGAAFCPSCGTPVAGPAAEDQGLRRYVPPELLNKLEFAARHGGMAGERRTVTMLFCDIQGSTAAAEGMDPEEWAEVMNGAFEHLIAPVYKYEGTLARLMGDAILAFFGAPIAHEDDPERAILAGLEILDGFEAYRAKISASWGIEVDVRVGVNTGLVVVGAVGSDLRVEYTAMGDAVNVAARMEQTAAPGTVQVSENTQRLVDPLFDFEDLGGVEVKGKKDPIEAFRVVRALPRPDNLRGIEGLTSPMVGREAELGDLVEGIQSTSTGAGTIISVLAEAGLGKSRLAEEARSVLGDQVEWHVGRSLSFETDTPYAPVARFLRSLVGLDVAEAPAASQSRIQESVADVLPGSVDDLAPFIMWILDVEVPEQQRHRIEYLEPPEVRKEAFNAVVRLMEAKAQRSPVVVQFEDLHWADPASLELVSELMRLTETVPLALVMLFRPRRDEASWEVHELAEREFPHRYRAISLKPLTEDETRDLIANLLAIDGLPDELRGVILERADGNPFFVEEIIRSMIDQGMVEFDGERWVAAASVATMNVPESVSAVLTTRLDALDEGARQIAQAAAVVGRQFRYDEVAACLPGIGGFDSGLLELQRRALIREVARVPKRLFRFSHALVQEAAYATVLLKTRTGYHAAIAEFLEATQPERVEDLAHHLLNAKLPDRALPYLVSAGEKAARTYAPRSALNQLQRALELIDDDTAPDLVRRTLETLGETLMFQFDLDGAADAFERLIEEGERRGDQAMLVSGLNKHSLLRGHLMGEREEAFSELKRAEEIARDLEVKEGLAESCMIQCYLRTATAEFDQVEYYMAETERLGTELGQTEPTLFGMVHLANTMVYLTRFDEAREQAQKALARAEELGSLRFQAELLTFAIPWSAMAAGEFEAAMAAVERGMEIAQQIGHRVSEGMGALLQGKVAQEMGHLEDALALFRRSARAFDSTGIPYIRAVALCVQGTCYRRIGGPMLDKANELHARASEMMEMPAGTVMGALLWTEMGQCALANGTVDKARELFIRALETRSAPMHLVRPLALMGMIDVALLGGDVGEARRLLDEASAYVEAKGMNDLAAPLALTSARVTRSEGDAAAALAMLEALAPGLEQFGMRRLLFDVMVEQAECLDARDRAVDASGVRSAAMELATAIAKEMESEELRSAFRQEAGARLGL